MMDDMEKTVVMRSDDARRAALEAEGWRVMARSFGAQLDADRVDRARLQEALAGSVGRAGAARELTADDVDAVLALDAATAGDYPGSVATRHRPVDRERATPLPSRRMFGVFSAAGELLALSVVDVDGAAAETDFTVVARDRRRQGLGIAVKALSVLTLVDDGVERFRTGGSADNTGILRANALLGYVRDEEWVTLEPGGC
jgi:hypothetical protein